MFRFFFPLFFSLLHFLSHFSFLKNFDFLEFASSPHKLYRIDRLLDNPLFYPLTQLDGFHILPPLFPAPMPLLLSRRESQLFF